MANRRLPTIDELNAALGKDEALPTIDELNAELRAGRPKIGYNEMAALSYEAQTGADAPENAALKHVANAGGVFAQGFAAGQMSAAQQLADGSARSDAETSRLLSRMIYGTVGGTISSWFATPDALEEWDRGEGARIADPAARMTSGRFPVVWETAGKLVATPVGQVVAKAAEALLTVAQCELGARPAAERDALVDGVLDRAGGDAEREAVRGQPRGHLRLQGRQGRAALQPGALQPEHADPRVRAPGARGGQGREPRAVGARHEARAGERVLRGDPEALGGGGRRLRLPAWERGGHLRRGAGDAAGRLGRAAGAGARRGAGARAGWASWSTSARAEEGEPGFDLDWEEARAAEHDRAGGAT